MANITTFDSKDLIVTVNNVNITGLGEDGASGEKDEAFFSTSYGVQGDCVVSVTNNDLGTVTITVQKTSPQYAYLLGLAKRREKFPLWCRNSNTGEVFGGTQAALENYLTVNLHLRYLIIHIQRKRIRAADDSRLEIILGGLLKWKNLRQ